MSTRIHWFRRDFRVRDNTALFAAAQDAGNDGNVIGIFIIDPRWWHADTGKLGPHQAEFWLRSLAELRDALAERNIPLIIKTNIDPVAALLALTRETQADAIAFNKEYEPAQIEMDERLQREAAKIGLSVRGYKDAVHFEEQEILTGQSGIYSVFTPYKNAYLKKLAIIPPAPLGLPRRANKQIPFASEKIPSLKSLGFETTSLDLKPGESSGTQLLEDFCKRGLTTYADTRNFPALTPGIQGTQVGTSRFSAHLNAGTISIRQALHAVLSAVSHQRAGSKNKKSADTFLTELIWREFYRMILFNYPETVTKPFNSRYHAITWQNDPKHFTAWQNGQTGYPIVDAAMMQLRQTGFMHNRLRMIAAMFLTKDLDTHWIHGERYFMRTLMDYDQASNVGGWQWSASTGTDAAPYFRVMNPVLQSERFDAKGHFIRHYLPALRQFPEKFIHEPWLMPLAIQRASKCVIGKDYPARIVDHAEAKAAAIAKFRIKK